MTRVLASLFLMAAAAVAVVAAGTVVKKDPAGYLPAGFAGDHQLRVLAQRFNLIPGDTTHDIPTDVQLNKWGNHVVVVQAEHHNGLLHLFSTDIQGEGTGFFISSHRLVTADHVVYASDQHRIGVSGSELSLAAEDHANDLAAADDGGAGGPPFPLLTARPGLDEDLWALCATTSSGQRTYGAQRLHVSVAATSISAHLEDNSVASGVHDVPNAIMLSGDGLSGASGVTAGCSGAPVLNGDGQAVGVLVGAAPNGPAYAIASQHVTQFLGNG